MNGREIYLCMKNDHYISRTFYGVYAADRMLDCGKPGLYVLNTDNSGSPGTHWLLVYVTADCDGHVFDSFGFRGLYKSRNADSVHGKVFNQIDVPLQSESNQTCGGYALYFARELAMGHTTKEMLSIFAMRNTMSNDCFVQSYLWTNFGKHLRMYE